MSKTADNQIEGVEALAREAGIDEDVIFDAYGACIPFITLDDFERDVRRCAELAKKTKYCGSYLVQTYAREIAEGNDFEYFEEITLEEDW